MEYDRRRAAGRWSEVVGSVATERDKLHREAGLAASAKRDYDALSAPATEMVDAYSAGVNGWLASGRELPPEFELVGIEPEQWEPWQCVAVFKMRHFAMGTLNRKLWRAAIESMLGPERARALLSVEPDAVSPEGASNNWALAGSRTASGKPLVAGDPHRQLDVPNVYHQNHVTGPDFDAIGLSFPGVPGVSHFGHNERVAWCVTHGMADDQDVLIDEDSSEAIVVWTSTAEVDTTFEAILGMLTAQTTAELDEVLRAWVMPCQNLICADVDGDIRYRLRGQACLTRRGESLGASSEHASTRVEGLGRIRQPASSREPVEWVHPHRQSAHRAERRPLHQPGLRGTVAGAPAHVVASRHERRDRRRYGGDPQ